MNAFCMNKIGSYNCQCNHGYSGNGFSCKGFVICKFFLSIFMLNIIIDINECLSGAHSCVNADCQNNNGSYSCLCEEGFYHSNSSDRQSICSKLIQSICSKMIDIMNKIILIGFL